MGNIGNQIRFRLFILPLFFDMSGQLLFHQTDTFRNMGQLSFAGDSDFRMKISCGNLLYASGKSFNIFSGFPLQEQENNGENQNSHQNKKKNTYGTDKGKALHQGIIISHLHQIIGIRPYI